MLNVVEARYNRNMSDTGLFVSFAMMTSHEKIASFVHAHRLRRLVRTCNLHRSAWTTGTLQGLVHTCGNNGEK